MYENSKVLSRGRLVVLTHGRRAGCKAVISDVVVLGKDHRLLVAGVSKAPRKITRKMNREQISQRIRMKTFVRPINLQHCIITRFIIPEFANDKTSPIDHTYLKKDSQSKSKLNKAFKIKLRDMYREGKAQALCSKLHF
ncbi:MAG: hypothetical protein MHPSP_003155 [Paramarteilia canceri]